MDLAVVEEMADMTEAVDVTEVEAIEVVMAEVTGGPEEDIREDRRLFRIDTIYIKENGRDQLWFHQGSDYTL
jgi:hypothetical protein